MVWDDLYDENLERYWQLLSRRRDLLMRKYCYQPGCDGHPHAGWLHDHNDLWRHPDDDDA